MSDLSCPKMPAAVATVIRRAAKQKTNYENRDNGKHTEAHEDCPFVYLCSGECVYLQFICISIFFRNFNINLYLLCHGDEVRFPLKLATLKAGRWIIELIEMGSSNLE